MTEQPVWSLTLALQEIQVLTSMLEVGAPVGLEELLPSEPLAGQPDVQLRSAIQTLTDRGLLELKPEGEIELDAAVVALIEAIAESDLTVAISCSSPYRASRLLCVHLAEDLIVEQERLSDGQVALTAIRDAETLADRVWEFMNLPQVLTAQGSTTEVNADNLAETRRLAETRDAHTCRAWLQRVGAPETTAIALAETLVGGQAISAVVLRREATEMRVNKSLAWLAGRAGVWSAQPVVGEIGQARIRLTPVTTAEVHSQIKRVFLHERHEEMESG